MVRLSEIPPEQARDFLREVLYRNRTREDTAWKVDLHLSVEDQRQLWAAEKYLEILETMNVGIEMTDFSLQNCRKYLAGHCRDDVVTLSQRDLRLIGDAERHLDRYCIMTMPEAFKPSKGKKK